MADQIRKGGKREAQRLLAEVANHIAQAMAWATLDPVCRAFVRYEKAVTGVDLAAGPSEHVRARAALTARSVNLGQAMARQDAAIARMHERAGQRQLASLRAAAQYGIAPLPVTSLSPPTSGRFVEPAATARATRVASAAQPRRADRGPEQRRSA
jgi:hypothetical protein